MGSTCCTISRQFQCRDHPHIHGEHAIRLVVVVGAVGSPPYTWGAPNRAKSTVSKFKDHPHIHGEHCHPVKLTQGLKGSPPYTWGALWCLIKKSPSPGITPIYMGSTQIVKQALTNLGDHPHIHGEHIKRSL